MTTKTYVMYLIVGTFFVDYTKRRVSTRNLVTARRKLPLNAFAFYFYDETSITRNGERFIGKIENKSKVYFPDAKLWTAVQIKKMGPSKYRSDLYRKAKQRGGKLLQCRTGNWQPFYEKTDRII